MKKESHQVWNYIDDFCVLLCLQKLTKVMSDLQELLAELGLTVSDKKQSLR